MNISNGHLIKLGVDNFHHLGFNTDTTDCKILFGDVKFVCISGSNDRVKGFAQFVSKELKITKEDDLVDLCHTDRFVMYKVGPVLTASHGMGVPSASILLHEIFKLLHYAEAEDVSFFRMGTCGGLGLQPGSLVITKQAVNGFLKPIHSQVVLGEVKEYDTTLQSGLSEELLSLVQNLEQKFDVKIGDTMCCDGFYEGQGRLDGAFCSYTEQDKFDFLEEAFKVGVRNIEMESLIFASMCNRAKVKAAIVCVVLVNRISGDQISITEEELREFSKRPWDLVIEYIKIRTSLNQN